MSRSHISSADNFLRNKKKRNLLKIMPLPRRTAMGSSEA
jgi:hypothetical protein